MERKEIRIEDTWDLSGLFADQAQFDTAMEQAKQLLSEITQAQGHITEFGQIRCLCQPGGGRHNVC